MQLRDPSSSPVYSIFSPFGLLFPNLKTNLHGRNFRSNEGIKDAVDEYLSGPGRGFYFEGIIKLDHCWKKCIEAKGDYIEK